jgi:Tfp pilus assembly protein PilN
VIGVNLIPSDVLLAHRRVRRIRRWIMVCVVAAALAALPVLWRVGQHARVAELAKVQRIRTAQVAAVRVELDRVTASLTDLNERIERANALRTKRSWAGLLSVAVQCMPEEVWLTSVATEAPASTGKQKHSAPSAAKEEEQSAVVVLEGARQLKLDGFALEHSYVYDFMGRLKASAVFDDVELLKAGKEPILWSQAVRFELLCTW